MHVAIFVDETWTPLLHLNEFVVVYVDVFVIFSSAIIARITIVNYKNKLTIDLQWHYTMLYVIFVLETGLSKVGNPPLIFIVAEQRQYTETG
jgi:hypothetical protein